ncbi:MAG TPA: hypothetical protein VF247_11065 [Candidatus Krumholzibacteria bacterium]
MSHRLLIALLSLCLVGVAGKAAALGSVYMTSSGNAVAGVTIDLTINDPSGGTCQWLGVVRGSFDDVYGSQNVIAVIARHPGTTFNAQILDTNVEPNTVYCYRMVLLPLGIPVVLPGCDDFCQLYDCFCDVQTCINTGSNPVLLGHGYLSTQNAGGDTAAYLYPCDGGQYPILGFATVSGTALQYADTGTPVFVYGQPYCCYAQCIWGWTATAAAPTTCVIATKQMTWGAVKSLYRE